MRLQSLRMASIGRFNRDDSGVSTIEFALILPLFITLGLTGVEIAYMSTVNMQVSQTAISLADNASRLGQTDNSAVTPTVTEADIDSIMAGALRQGQSFDLEENGRIILSSLEYDDATGLQYIHWQRCRGDLDRDSAYGDDGENNGLGETQITGVGSSGTPITAAPNSAVMVAEIYYEYEGIIGGSIGRSAEFHQEAIFAIRDDRNLTPGVTGVGGDSDCS
ncbi:TadE/TadG family type IV pilus assembly protein [Aurantiacibacter poecillastricola]|uniref:TadE/TadG family type IV pilus assembly protein n=1 Tax=Aurantiacibacter poecillastricola TaxID=3064385 RepID=UPI00273F6F44|nr:TadE/TadG family type IV pilus assembly protein [Aurantiacibacter sp. 219JJ12-13]MDP5260625.1 pilus assembly protein [Aurantiacibacter sp. 219JJ12-13]